MLLKQVTVDANSSVETFFAQMGKFALLIGSTDAFSQVRMDFAMSLIHGALTNNTYALYTDNEGKPVAGVIWALIDQETTDFYLKYGVMPSIEAWRSGPDLWFMNVVAEGGTIKMVFDDLKKNIFGDHKEAFMLRPGRHGKRRIVRITHSGTRVVRTLPGIKASEAEAAPGL